MLSHLVLLWLIPGRFEIQGFRLIIIGILGMLVVFVVALGFVWLYSKDYPSPVCWILVTAWL